jgi:hypothetical protein
VAIFTKFDGQIINEFANLTDAKDEYKGERAREFANLMDAKDEDKWERARKIAESTFQKDYLPRVLLGTKYPPKAHVKLKGENGQYSLMQNEKKCCFIDMDLPETDCPELTQITADAIDNTSIHQLFVLTQMNNLDLCVKSALK